MIDYAVIDSYHFNNRHKICQSINISKTDAMRSYESSSKKININNSKKASIVLFKNLYGNYPDKVTVPFDFTKKLISLNLFSGDFVSF